MGQWINIGKTSQFAEMQPKCIKTRDLEVLVTLIENTFYAIENICTHDGGELAGGCSNDGEIICPRHGAKFSLTTGEALSAPAYEGVHVFPTRVVNDEVEVQDDRWD